MTQPPADPGPPDAPGNDPDHQQGPTYPAPPPVPQPPANPYGQAPYGQAPSAPYGQAPYGQAPYGQAPGAPYGQAPSGPFGPGAPYGQPFPGGPGQPRPSQALAATALVLAFLSCTGVLGIVAIVLAIVVLRRNRDGRNHGTGMAIAAIVISVALMLATAAIVALVAVEVNNFDDVNDLSRGDCFEAHGLTTNDDRFTSVEIVPCDEPHDAEVIETVTLSSDEAARYAEDDDFGSTLCEEATEGWVPHSTADLKPMYVTDEADPDAGDKVACVVTGAAGKRLTDPVG